MCITPGPQPMKLLLLAKPFVGSISFQLFLQRQIQNKNWISFYSFSLCVFHQQSLTDIELGNFTNQLFHALLTFLITRVLHNWAYSKFWVFKMVTNGTRVNPKCVLWNNWLENQTQHYYMTALPLPLRYCINWYDRLVFVKIKFPSIKWNDSKAIETVI